MTQVSVKDQIKKLVELQKVDAEIYEFKKQLTEKPAVIEELKVKFEDSKASLNQLETQLKNIQVERKNKELDLKSKEEEIVKANAQLSALKTNKEYTAKISEMEHIKADMSIIEEKILESYDKTDAVSAEINKEKVVVAGYEKDFTNKKKEVEDEMRILEDRVKVLDSQRKQLLPTVDPNFLNRYEKILSHKHGIAIVPIQNNICGGCYMNIPQQTINAIRMHDTLVSCEMCLRILYLEDDL